MRITVKLGEPLWRLAGSRRVQLDLPEGASVSDALEALERNFPGLGERIAGRDPALLVPYNLFVNTRIVSLEARQTTQLAEGNTLFIFLPAAGG